MLLLIVGGALLIGGYFIAKKLHSSGPELGFEISYEQENKLGNLFNDMILNQYSVVEDNAADSALQTITARLIRGLDSTKYKYRFVILRSNQVNAFTIPGGNIYVFSGLLEFAENPEEIAAVLSHEIGHAEKRHVVSKLVKELSITAIVTTLSGGDPSILARVLKEIIGNSFDREQENDADQFGLKLLEKSRISPKYFALFFERLSAKDLDYNENLEILMTHPHNSKRIENAKRYKVENDFHPEPFHIDWKKVKGSLK
jgi:predicted Zn-dependent protease